MATVLEELVSKIRFVVDGRGLKQTRDELGRFQGKAKDTSNVLGALRRSMIEAFAGRAALQGLAGLVRFVVHTNVEFQRLSASLKTVTGSAQAADTAFAAIKKFARETPYSVQEVTTAFVRLKALGLDASEDSLRSYGNTASAMGKNILEFIEAVADASTFEFERLKEFGIKASQAGDKVTFTFQGQQTTVQKSAEAVERYLKQIGDKQFAGAMEEQMKTLGGAFANLNDAIEQFAVDIGEAGLAEAIRTISLDLAEMAGSGSSVAKMIGTKLGKGLSMLWAKLKELAPAFADLLDHLPQILDVFGQIGKLILDLIVGFAKFVTAVGGIDTAIKILLPGLAAMRVATIAAAGPWGVLVAAMLAAIPIAKEAADAVAMSLASVNHDLVALDMLNGGRTTKRGQQLWDRKHGEAGFEVARSKIRDLDDEDLGRLADAADDPSVSADIFALARAERDRRDKVKLKRKIGEAVLGQANDAAGELAEAANKNARRLTFDALMRKKRSGKSLTPSEKKRLTALSKEMDLSTDKGKKGKKEKKEKDSAGLHEIKERVDELVEAEEMRVFHRAGGDTAAREHAAKTAGEARRAALMREVDRGNVTVLGGKFSREKQMMRDAGLLDEAMNAAPPVLTVNIAKYDVKVDSPIEVHVASANATAGDIASALKTQVVQIFRGEVRTAIETVKPVQKV